jgi:hypothetical protein
VDTISRGDMRSLLGARAETALGRCRGFSGGGVRRGAAGPENSSVLDYEVSVSLELAKTYSGTTPDQRRNHEVSKDARPRRCRGRGPDGFRGRRHGFRGNHTL